MPRGKSVVKPRGYRPYASYDVVEQQLVSLRAFLSFVYDSDLDVREQWSRLFTVLCRLTLEEIREQSEDIYRLIVTRVHPEGLGWLRKKARPWFEKMIQDLQAGKPFRVKGIELELSKFTLSSGDQIFWSGSGLPEVENHRGVLKELKRCVVEDLAQLRTSALLRCTACQRLFLRTDQREAEYCSQRCRNRAYEERHHRKRRKEKIIDGEKR